MQMENASCVIPNPHACPSMSPAVEVHDRDRAAYCRCQPPARQTANELLPSAHLVAATQLFYSSRRYVVSPCPVVHFRPRYNRSTDDAQNYQTCHESIHDADLATRSKHRPRSHCLYTTRVLAPFCLVASSSSLRLIPFERAIG